MGFVQLQVSSAYRLLTSTLSIETLVEEAVKRQYQAVALTDKNVLYGAVDFYKLCKKNNIKPIIGLTLEVQGTILKDEQFALVLLAKNSLGYQSLLSLSSKKMSYEKMITLTDISEHAENLIGITPGLMGEVETLLLQGDTGNAKKAAEYWKIIFPPTQFFLGLQLHEELKTIQRPLRLLSQTVQVPLAGLNDVLYENPDDAFTFQVLRAIDEGGQVDGEETSLDGTHDLSTPSIMQSRFQSKGFQDAAENTEVIAQQINTDIPLNQELLPKFPLPKNQQITTYLKELCIKGLTKRVSNPDDRYYERLTYELDVIKKMGFEDYFLIVWDLMAYAHESKIVTGAGRGSAAGSLVSYVLDITDVDPIQYKLLFERFLNEERYNMPDIDLDFPDNRREEMLDYVREKYGNSHVAQIITFGTLGAKMAVRDTARVLGLTQAEANKWSKAIPSSIGMTLSKALQTSKAVQQLIQENPLNQKLFDIAKKIEGLPRHVSTHAAGIVISDQPLTNTIPVQKGSGEMLLTQYPMGNVEEIGLLKMDFLGLKNLTILDNALKVIEFNTGEQLKLKDLPINDKQTMQLFKRADTAGIFQFESSGIKSVLKRLQPETIEDIAAVNALYRPGPMEQIDQFVQRKKGETSIEYPHHNLKEILKVTYGVMVYQEQVMQVASKMAGYTLGQADILRRAIGKKKKEIIDEERNHFITGSIEKGYTRKEAISVYDYIERFANYGFNRSHAVAYSFIAYQMAYLKVHYPQAFFVALLNAAAHRSDKLKDYLFEAKKKKIPIYSPDINQSMSGFIQKNKAILFGFNSVKGLRRDMIKNIIENRKENGPYKDFTDFLKRIDSKWLKEEIIQPLIYTGAFQSFGYSKATLLYSMESIISSVKLSGDNVELFDILQPKYTVIPELSMEEQLEAEEYYLGVYLSGHPAETYESLLAIKQGGYIKELKPKRVEKIVGLVKNIKKITTKKGEPMAFLDVSDASGTCSVTLFPKVYRKYIQDIEEGNILYIEGKAEQRLSKELQLVAYQIEKAEKIAERYTNSKCFVRIVSKMDQSDTLTKVKNTLQQYKGTIPVILYYEKQGKKVLLKEKYWVKNDDNLLKKIEFILGEGNIIIR